MRFPELRSPELRREMLDTFLGYNGGERPGAGEFSYMENLSSDDYPLLSPRKKRGIYARPQSGGSMIARDTLCYVDGSRFVIDGYPIEMGLSEGLKQLVSMGAYVLIFPDGKYISTVNHSDTGRVDAEFTARGEVTFSPAGLDGATQEPNYVQGEAPEEPENMALWMDTSMNPAVLMQWSAGAGMWVPVTESFVKISFPGIGAAFGQYDGVTITGLPESLSTMEGSTVIWHRGEDFLLVPGVLARVLTEECTLTVSRKMPQMDFIIESGNRLWGCRYGLDAEGRPVNEIYASKLGDFKNWNCFMGLSSDSYAVSLGADGAFTGAISHMGYPLFFRENCIHKVYGNYPANFRLQTTPCRGVQRGSEKSLAILGEVLYYKSTAGICAYDGAMPAEVSRALGQKRYFGAAAGAFGNKYYISMHDAGGEYHLFVYDGARNLWHREDNTHALAFCACRDELYFLDDSSVIRTVFGSGEEEERVHWAAQTGPLGMESPDNKYLSRISLRLWLEKGARVKISVQYDSGPDWEQAAVLRGTRLGSFTLPLRLRRCDHLRLKLEGWGDARLYSITKTTEAGSDVF